MKEVLKGKEGRSQRATIRGDVGHVFQCLKFCVITGTRHAACLKTIIVLIDLHIRS